MTGYCDAYGSVDCSKVSFVDSSADHSIDHFVKGSVRGSSIHNSSMCNSSVDNSVQGMCVRPEVIGSMLIYPPDDEIAGYHVEIINSN
jgi:hypothetical protein